MTPSQRIEARLIAQVRHDAETITDPVALVEAAKAGGYWWAQVSAFTGADQSHAREKFVVGTKGKVDASPEKYRQYAKPMNAENFPGDAYARDKALERFHERIISELDGMLGRAAAMHWIVPIYLENDGRFPDAEGFALWVGLLADGHSEDTVRGWIINGFAEVHGN